MDDDALKEIHLIFSSPEKNLKITNFTLGTTEPLNNEVVGEGGGTAAGADVQGNKAAEQQAKEAANTPDPDSTEATRKEVVTKHVDQVMNGVVSDMANANANEHKTTDGGSKRGGKKSRKPKSKRIRVRKTRRRKH